MIWKLRLNDKIDWSLVPDDVMSIKLIDGSSPVLLKKSNNGWLYKMRDNQDWIYTPHEPKGHFGWNGKIVSVIHNRPRGSWSDKVIEPKPVKEEVKLYSVHTRTQLITHGVERAEAFDTAKKYASLNNAQVFVSEVKYQSKTIVEIEELCL